MLNSVSQQPEVNSQLDANLAKQFAWLLREDLRKTFKTVDNPAFAEWWLIKGRQEYPAWAHATPSQELQPLFESAGKATIAGVSLDVPKVVQKLARYREDAVREYTRDGKLDNEKFFAWAMVVGLADHQLAVYAPTHILAMLDQTVPMPETTPDEKATATANPPVPAPTLLMYLLWHLMDEPTQQARNIFKTGGRLAYMDWFFSVVGQLNFAPLVAGRWKSWVKSQLSYRGSQLEWAHAVPAISVPSNHKNKADKPFGVNLYGFAYGELGIGEDLRMAVACCEAANIPYHVVNVDAGNTSQADQYLKGKVGDTKGLPPYSTNIFCLPAFDTVSRVFMQKGAVVFNGYVNVGWWQWELAVFPKAWKPHVFNIVDEIWASSKFLEKMYKQATHKPVKLVPLAVSVERFKPYSRLHFGLKKNKFIFLYIFDFNSSVARKNPMATVLAFKHAFDINDKSVCLVIKTMNSSPNSNEWLDFVSECKKDNRIKIITDTLNRSEVLGLINACDVYISLHRSEGFGRTIAEAILLDKKIITTNYSGNKDYMVENNDALVKYTEKKVVDNEYHWIDASDNALWADADIFDASAKMKILRTGKNLNFKYDKFIFSSEYIGQIVINALSSKS